MAEQKEDLDRNEPATPFKLEKAHRRGSIVRSSELTFAFVLLVCVACVYGLGAQVRDDTASLVRRGLAFVAREGLTQASALAYAFALGLQALTAIAPVLFAVWLAALAVAALQARGVFTAHPLKPDFTRVNPANGFKRIFSMKSLHELWRSSAKIGVIAVATAIWGRHHSEEIVRLLGQAPRSMTQTGIALLGSCLSLLAGLMLAFALIDWSLNRWEFMRNMRMSKREIKDEHKEREGDPRIKARLRELRLEWLKRARQLSKVRSADVLVTNPTHYAVALEYRSGEMPAPMITARGAGEMARRMRAEAHRRAVPVVEHPPLARALFALNESQLFVPEENFGQVARVLRWVYAARAHGNARRAPA
jgi:flagellar biosynthetic protein FlhB